MKPSFLIILFTFTLPVYAQTPCLDGLAEGYPCNQVSFYARISPQDLGAVENNGFYLNDIWGWTDQETGKEYAIVGLTDGVAFVDITSPATPVVIGKLIEPPGAAQRMSASQEVQHGKSNWRDMKVYKDHVFVVSDGNAEHGMQVFDLTRLREYDGSTFQEFAEDTRYDGINSAHNIVINEETGYAYIVGATTGSTCNAGGLHILNIQDPLNPAYIGCFDEDGYTHDAQCVIYEGPDGDYQGKEICFNSNEDTFTIVDVDNKEDMNLVSRTGYEKARYSHQGWLTEDHRFFLMNDELDEFEFEFNPRTLIWNVEDLDNPVLIGEFYNEEASVDHNLYVHQGLVYESNYLSGLRILESDRIAEGILRERAFFDTYPEANEIHYGGAWSNYPFFESGTIAVSDMVNGLFLIKLDTLEHRISKSPANKAQCEGTETFFELGINEESNLTYQWQFFEGIGFADLTESVGLIGSTTSQNLDMKAIEDYVNTPIRCKVTDQNGNLFYSYPAQYEFTDVLPDVSFTFQVMDKTVSFTNTTRNATSYEWHFGDGETSTEENPTHLFPASDIFEVKLKAYNNCGVDSLTQFTSVILSLEAKDEKIKIFPNPAKDQLILNIESKQDIQLLTLSGQVLLQKNVSAGTHHISLETYMKGVYLLKVTSGKKTQIRKIVIQ